jgi:hypothetical protein
VDGRHAWGTGDDAGQIERVDGGDSDEFAGLGRLADAAQRFDGLRAGILLTVETSDEAAAADCPLRLHAAEAAQDLAPGNADVLGADEVAEDDAVAEEELLGPGFGELFEVELGIVRTTLYRAEA